MSGRPFRPGTGEVNKFNFGVSYQVTALQTGNYACDDDDYYVQVNTDAARTITLPSVFPGRSVMVKDAAGAGANVNAITVQGKNGETIDGAANNQITAARGQRKYYSDGTVWFVGT